MGNRALRKKVGLIFKARGWGKFDPSGRRANAWQLRLALIFAKDIVYDRIVFSNIHVKWIRHPSLIGHIADVYGETDIVLWNRKKYDTYPHYVAPAKSREEIEKDIMFITHNEAIENCKAVISAGGHVHDEGGFLLPEWRFWEQ